MAAFKLAAVTAKLLPGGFPSEVVAEIELANKEPYRGIVPVHFCWKTSKVPLDEQTQISKDGLSGLVAVRIEKVNDDETETCVSIPNGMLLWVRTESIKDAPNKVRPSYVSV